MTPEHLFTQPLYLQLRDALAARIARGEWKVGTAIPGEGDLARELGVSKGTVRKALDLLEGESLLIRRQGRGTFVVDPGSEGAGQRFNHFRLANGAIVDGVACTLAVALAEASPSECERLQLVTGNKVYRIRRLRSRQGKAFMIENASLPAALFPQLVERDLRSHRLVEIAQAYSVLLGSSAERVLAETCSASAAEALRIEPGTPVLILDRVIRTRDGRPAEWRRAECVPGEMHYQVTWR
jgi:GntR family transcriptional regulator